METFLISVIALISWTASCRLASRKIIFKTLLDSVTLPDLFIISKKGLENRNELNSKKQNEVKFLDHIKTIIDTKSTNAESIIAKYRKDKNFFNINEK